MTRGATHGAAGGWAKRGAILGIHLVAGMVPMEILGQWAERADAPTMISARYRAAMSSSCGRNAWLRPAATAFYVHLRLFTRPTQFQ